MKITDEKSYDEAIERIEYLNNLVDDNTPQDDPYFVELKMLVEEADAYEEIHYPIPAPTFLELVQLRMEEMGLNQKNLAKLLHISPARLSAYLHGKREPTLSVAREISRTLDIEPAIVLGV